LELPDSPPAELEPADEPAPESIGEPEELWPDDAEPLDEVSEPGELGELLDGALGLLLVAPGDVSPLFLERFVPELLSRALFLQAPRPRSGRTSIIARNVLNDIYPPPFMDLQRNRCFFRSSSRGGGVNGDIYWIQVNLLEEDFVEGG
jgi:hypothetical protein